MFQLQHARKDYKEFLELAIMFLNEKPERGIHFTVPGAMHHARWMSKGIYDLKMFLFRNEFALTKRETNNIRDMAVFIIKVYLQPWFEAQTPEFAPRNDLLLLQNLISYKDVKKPISEIGLKKISDHLWYLSEQLVGLAFLIHEYQMKKND